MTIFSIQTIVNNIDDLSPAERRVARAIINGYPFVVLRGIKEIAATAAVSQPTVIRFARRLGFDGFPPLQRAVVDALEANAVLPTSARETVSVDSSARKNMELIASNKVGQRALGNIQTLVSQLSEKRIKACVKLLCNTSLRVVGLGGVWSRPMASYFIYMLNHLRANVALLQDHQIPIIDQIADLKHRTVLVVFDFETYQNSTVAVARMVRNESGKVVLITDENLSPIADFASIVFTAPIAVDMPQTSSVATLTLVEMLLSEVAAEMGDSVESRILRIQKRRQSVDELTPGSVI